MKNFLYSILSLLVIFSFSSCELIGDIFQAGMVVGIIIVVIVVGLIFWIIKKISG